MQRIIHIFLVTAMMLAILGVYECPYIGDTDKDGIKDDVDNCLEVSNSDQKDTDGDKVGDVCDNCPLDDQNDVDKDTICGDVDNCPLVVNKEQMDCDSDELGDVCDSDNSSCAPEGMVYVPAGNFWRGSCNENTSPWCQAGAPGYYKNEDDFYIDNETPLREIYLDGYFIDTYEVTVAEFGECVAAGACIADNFGTKDDCEYCNYGYSDRDDHPMNCVSWYGAEEYCVYVGKSLPSEAQWEKAARGTDGRLYPWGDEYPSCEYAVMYGDGGYGCGMGSTWPVGSKPKGISPYGAYDMAGNVYEWVADRYGEEYYSESPGSNPMGPGYDLERVLRGGCWYYGSGSNDLRAANRYYAYPSYDGANIGFRCHSGQK
jgi:formylglycine-generating enzyme required for sulfatase activity